MLNLSANPTAVRVQMFSASTGTSSSNQVVSLLAAEALGLNGVALIWLGLLDPKRRESHLDGELPNR